MPKYSMRLVVDGTRLDAMQRMAKTYFGDALVSCTKVDLASSRAQRLALIEQVVADCAADVEELKEEMEEWGDSIPESLQGGGKAEEVEQAISDLEELKDNLEGLDFTSVSFPSMF